MTTGNLSPGQFNADQVIAPDVGRVTARKDNTQDTIRLAIFHSSTTGKPQHIYQTHYGWEVDAFPPPGGQAHYRAEPTGRVLRVTRDIRSGETSEEHRGLTAWFRRPRPTELGWSADRSLRGRPGNERKG